MARKKQSIDFVKIFKILDPVLQSVFLILYFFYTDTNVKGTKYHLIIMTLLRWQTVSALIQIFIKFHKKLKLERWLFIAAVFVFFYLYKKINLGFDESYLSVVTGRGPTKIGAHDFALMAFGIGLGFWYYVICFREVNALLNKKKRH